MEAMKGRLPPNAQNSNGPTVRPQPMSSVELAESQNQIDEFSPEDTNDAQGQSGKV